MEEEEEQEGVEEEVEGRRTGGREEDGVEEEAGVEKEEAEGDKTTVKRRKMKCRLLIPYFKQIYILNNSYKHNTGNPTTDHKVTLLQQATGKSVILKPDPSEPDYKAPFPNKHHAELWSGVKVEVDVLGSRS